MTADNSGFGFDIPLEPTEQSAEPGDLAHGEFIGAVSIRILMRLHLDALVEICDDAAVIYGNLTEIP